VNEIEGEEFTIERGDRRCDGRHMCI